MRRIVAPLAIGMTVLYLALAIGAAGCLSLHSGPSTAAHHHSQSHVAHSALCAWACQANPTATVLSIAPTKVVFALLLLLPLLVTALNTRLSASVPLSRAPPR